MKETQISDIEISTDYSDSSVSEIDEIDKVDQLYDLDSDALLATINAISSCINLKFNTLIEAIKKDNPLKFVKIFLKDDEDFIQAMNSSRGKINDIIKYLGEKEPIFNILLFNFKEKSMHIHQQNPFIEHF